MAKTFSSLTLQFVPYSEVERLDTVGRIKKLLKIVLQNKIVILQGKLKVEEEARLIEDTMALVGSIKGFKGIELAVLSPKLEDMPIVMRMRRQFARALIGEQDAITIIGPASIIREIKKDPSRIQVLLKGK
ncbi:DUF2073 domain-containing protein [Candidatus Pacearchaeota archaeon]|nr:DUF2073 domain-containing protein [Candidatus Pacearchaeota archaeon]